MSKTQPVSIALTDYEFGRKLYRMCQPYESCTSQSMRDGWNDAESDEAWALFADEPRQAVRFSEAALSEASSTYRNAYRFQGVDYTEPSVQ